MPRMDGKPIDSSILPILLRQGVRNDTSHKAVREALLTLDEGLAFELREPALVRDGSE